MLTHPVENRLQVAILGFVFADKLSPQAALAKAVREHPDSQLLSWVFVTTRLASSLRKRRPCDVHWTYDDWLEAAASLACDVYALSALGVTSPTGKDLEQLWSTEDPHLK